MLYKYPPSFSKPKPRSFSYRILPITYWIINHLISSQLQSCPMEEMFYVSKCEKHMPQETVPRILGGGANPLFTICHHVLLCRMDTEGFLGRVSGSWSTAHFVLRHKAHHTLLPYPYLNCLSIKKKLPVFPALPSEAVS